MRKIASSRRIESRKEDLINQPFHQILVWMAEFAEIVCERGRLVDWRKMFDCCSFRYVCMKSIINVKLARPYVNL
jgi:hypothetical protein